MILTIDLECNEQKYKKIFCVLMQIEFDDGSVKVVPREELWLEGEELPKNIQSRLVSHKIQKKKKS